MKTAVLLLGAVIFASPLIAQQQRLSSDYEIQSIQKELARDQRPLARMAGYLNLGDLYSTRGESSRSIESYRSALAAAGKERMHAREASDLTRYANATSYAALASAKLGHDSDAFSLFEESTRYLSSSAKTWNLYASGMMVLQRNRKAAAAARNAVTIGERITAAEPTIANRLDLAVYQYSLASALVADSPAEAESLLHKIVNSLTSDAFAALRDRIARSELFEVYSTTSSDESAYLSLLNRSRLRLGSIYEERGDITAARKQYEEVLRLRNDEPTALARMARLTSENAEKLRYFSEAFAANPFSFELVKSYESFVASRRGVRTEGNDTSQKVRAVVEQLAAGNPRGSLSLISQIEKSSGANDTISYLKAQAFSAAGDQAAARATAASIRQVPVRRAAESDLSSALSEPSFLQKQMARVDDPSAGDLRKTLEILSDPGSVSAREALDATVFSSAATFDSFTPEGDGTTAMLSGTVAGVPFRFSLPMKFRGTFDASAPLRMDFRILGAVTSEADASLLVEPLKVVRQ